MTSPSTAATATPAASARGLAVPVGAWVAVLAVLYVLAWGGGMAWSHRSPSLDNAEQLVWAYAMEAGYWKHPPLPSWILHGLLQVFGPSVALPFFATQACVVIALALTWRLGCEFMSPAWSLVAAGLTSLVSYHGYGADAYNHNSVLLPFQAAATLFFYLALRRERWSLWLLAGLFAGLSMLVKYVAVFPLAALLLYMAFDRAVQTRRHFIGLGLAAAVGLAVCLPHLAWLWANDFLPLHYMHSVTAPTGGFGASAVSLAEFLGGQLLRILALLAVLAWALRRRGAATAPGMPAKDRLFLWCAGALPLALISGYGFATETELLARWGSNVFLLAGWLALDAVRRRPLPGKVAMLRGVLVAQLVTWVAVIVIGPMAGERLHLRGRTEFPGELLAALARHTWREHTATPLRIVVSDIWLAGNVAAHGRAPIAVLIDGEPTRAPWVHEADIARCGALVLQRAGDKGETGAVTRWLAQAALHGEWSLPWTGKGHASDDVRVHWGIVPPGDGRGCTL